MHAHAPVIKKKRNPVPVLIDRFAHHLHVFRVDSQIHSCLMDSGIPEELFHSALCGKLSYVQIPEGLSIGNIFILLHIFPDHFIRGAQPCAGPWRQEIDRLSSDCQPVTIEKLHDRQVIGLCRCNLFGILQNMIKIIPVRIDNARILHLNNLLLIVADEQHARAANDIVRKSDGV